MSSKSEKPKRPGEVLAHRVREIRARRGWTQQQVADRLAAVGYPSHRLTVAKIEKGGTRADNAPLSEILALAAALDVAPVHLIVPLEDETAVAVTPGLVVPAAVARAWVRGKHPLAVQPNPNDLRAFASERPAQEIQEEMATASGISPVVQLLHRLADPDWEVGREAQKLLRQANREQEDNDG